MKSDITTAPIDSRSIQVAEITDESLRNWLNAHNGLWWGPEIYEELCRDREFQDEWIEAQIEADNRLHRAEKARNKAYRIVIITVVLGIVAALATLIFMQE